HQRLRARVPVDAHVRMIDLDTRLEVVRILNDAGAGDDLAARRLKRAVRSEFAAQARRQRQVGFDEAVTEACGKQNVVERNLPCLDADGADTAFERPQRSADLPRPLRIFRFHTEDDAAEVWTRKAHIDAAKAPALAAALIVDG